MIVTDEETDVTELLWVVVIVDVDIWVVFCDTLVTLVVDFKVVEVVFVEIRGVVILDVMGFKVVSVPFFETDVPGVVDGFAVGFEVVIVSFFEGEETGVVDGFPVLLEDSFVWLTGTCGLFPGSAVRFASSTGAFLLEDPSEASLSTATFSSASTSSAPTMKKAQPLRAPRPIVLSAGCGGLVGFQPRWRLRQRERPFRAPEPTGSPFRRSRLPSSHLPPMTK